MDFLCSVLEHGAWSVLIIWTGTSNFVTWDVQIILELWPVESSLGKVRLNFLDDVFFPNKRLNTRTWGVYRSSLCTRHVKYWVNRIGRHSKGETRTVPIAANFARRNYWRTTERSWWDIQEGTSQEVFLFEGKSTLILANGFLGNLHLPLKKWFLLSIFRFLSIIYIWIALLRLHPTTQFRWDFVLPRERLFS